MCKLKIQHFFYMKESTIKMPVACRVSAEFRRQLEIEASAKGQNLSVYIESVLANRHTSTDTEGVEAEMLGKFTVEHQRAETLAAENQRLIAASKSVQIQQDNDRILALKAQLTQSESQYQELLQRHASVKTERDDLDTAATEMFGKMTAKSECVEALEAENAQLKAASKAKQVQQDNERILALKNQLTQSEQHYQDLLQRHTSVKTERDALAKVPTNTLPKWWSPEHYNLTIPYMKELSSKHPDYSAEQLLLTAVAVAAANEENNFFVYTLKDFWRKNPHFLNLQTPVATR